MDKKWIGCAAANFRAGRSSGLKPEAIVIHIMDGTLTGTDGWFNNPIAQVSAHYGVGKQGEIHQYVQETDTAFHAGTVVNPSWPLLKPGVNPNFYTIGIEHEGRPDDQWPAVQIETSAGLVGEVAARWNIPLDNMHVIPHHQIKSTKTCPGNVIRIEDILARVPKSNGTAGPPAALPNAVRVTHNLNLRSQASITAPVVRMVPAGTTINITATVQGDSVKGNANWYADADGSFLWAGGTDRPNPR
jgi:N-acetylmuramoyl-L-alanine amidase